MSRRVLAAAVILALGGCAHANPAAPKNATPRAGEVETESESETQHWLAEHLPEFAVEEAPISQAGVDQGYLYLKTAGVSELRGYYVFKLELRRLKREIRLRDDSRDAPVLDLMASGPGAIVRETREMNGNAETLVLAHLEISCGHRALATEMQRALKRLIQSAGG